MSRGTLALALGISICASCFPPGVSGPGFRWAPPRIRGPHWDELVAGLHATLTVVDEYRGTRVYVVHLPEVRITQVYLPFVDAIDACSIPGSDGAYVLLTDGRIVRTTDELDSKPVFDAKGELERGSRIALSPDASTIALLHQPADGDLDPGKTYRLTLIDLPTGRSSDLPGEFSCDRPCWVPGGESLFLTAIDRTVVEYSLSADRAVRPIDSGRTPLVCEDGVPLLFHVRAPGARDGNGGSGVDGWSLVRAERGASGVVAEIPLPADVSRGILAVSMQGLVVHESKPDERLPLEHSGLLLMGPYWRGGISLTDPGTGATETLFVGLIPCSIQWRWD